jgi:hypothetical protein
MDLRTRLAVALEAPDPVGELERIVAEEQARALLQSAEAIRQTGRLLHGQPGDRHRRYAFNRAAEVLVRRGLETRRRTR